MITYLCSMKEAKIYKIVDKSNNDNYIGSSKQKSLKARPLKKTHEFYKNRKYEDCEVIILEIFKYETKQDILWKEREWIEKTDCINKNLPILTEEERKQQKLNNAINWNNNNNERVKELDRSRYHYKNSWGGEMRTHNNLLKIDVNLFT